MSKWIKIGTVMKRKSGKGSYLQINSQGNPNKNGLGAVKLSVKTESGWEEVAVSANQKGLILSIMDPRARPGISDDEKARVPDFVKAEIFLPPSENK